MGSEDELLSKRKRKSGEGSTGGKRKKSIDLRLAEADKERLEKLVLGDASFMLRNLGVGDSDSGVEDNCASDSESRKPAWEDEDDQGIRVDDSGFKDDRRRKRFNETFGEPSWAKLRKEAPESEDEDLSILRTAGKLTVQPSHLPKGSLRIKQLTSLNNETRSEGPVIKQVEFHPTSTVALVAGLSGIASIFQVDGKKNSKLASVQFEKFPIRCAHFTQDGSAFIVGSNLHSYFYVYDMMEGASVKVPTHHNMGQTNMKNFKISPDGKVIAVVGRYGQVHLLSARSKEWITNLSHNSNVTSISFSPDGSILYGHTDLGEVYVWDMESRSVVMRFQDEGTLIGSVMSSSDDYLAIGSSWGVVNLYERPEKTSTPQPKPIKVFNHLVTQITSLGFNPTQEILAFSSDEKENHIKLAHLPSMTVFSNFPNAQVDVGRVQAFDFSPASGYFGCVNSRSTASLFRLNHFGSY